MSCIKSLPIFTQNDIERCTVILHPHAVGLMLFSCIDSAEFDVGDMGDSGKQKEI